MSSIFDQSDLTSAFHNTRSCSKALLTRFTHSPELFVTLSCCIKLRPGVPEDEGQHLQDVFPRASEFGGTRFGCHSEAYLDDTSQLITTSNAHRLWNSWSRWWDPSKSIYIEKSPPNIAKFLFLQSIFKESQRNIFVAVVRHPVALLYKRFFGFGGKDGGDSELLETTAKHSTKDHLQNAMALRLDCWSVTSTEK